MIVAYSKRKHTQGFPLRHILTDQSDDGKDAVGACGCKLNDPVRFRSTLLLVTCARCKRAWEARVLR